MIRTSNTFSIRKTDYVSGISEVGGKGVYGLYYTIACIGRQVLSIQPKFKLYSLGTLITSMINAKSRKKKYIFSFSVRLNNVSCYVLTSLSTLSNFVKVIGWNTISSWNLFITGCSFSEGFVLSSILPKNIWVNLGNNLSSYFGLIDE